MNKIKTILVITSSNHLKNYGDLAIIKTCLERIERLFPYARIYASTENPALLNKMFPRILPISARVISFWIEKSYQKNNTFHYRKKNITPLRNPVRVIQRIISGQDIKVFNRVFLSADLVVATGGGYLNDLFAQQAYDVLEIIDLANNQRKYTAIFSQGIGPINNRTLENKLMSVLPKVGLICVRDDKYSPVLLSKYRVNRDKILFTGDDGLLQSIGKDTNGEGVGFNTRVSVYSGIKISQLNKLVRSAILFTRNKKTKIIPLPISEYEKESDSKSLQLLLSIMMKNQVESYPEDLSGLLENIRKCRFTVSCSYHAALFSLANGIPVLAISNTLYYDYKFKSLSQIYPGGVIVTGQNQLSKVDLKTYFSYLWNLSQDKRQEFIKISKKLIYKNRSAYKRLLTLTVIKQ